MRLPFAAVALLLLPAFSPLRAGDPKSTPAEPQSPPFHLSGEYDLEDSYVGDGDVRRDSRTSSFDENYSLARFVLTPRFSRGYLRLGAEWERFSFGLSSRSPLPNTLQSVSLVVGVDTNIGNSIIVRAEARPGIYAGSYRELSSGDFNVPFALGATYIFSPELQLILGIGVDIDRKYPVLPGVGVRYAFAPHWVANVILPAPRLEYEVNHSLTVYVGAEFKDGTFRVDHDFGDQHGDPRLNHAVVSFSELRTGAGLTYKITPSITLSGEGGAQVTREFDFYRADARYRTDGVAPYGMLSLHGAF